MSGISGGNSPESRAGQVGLQRLITGDTAATEFANIHDKTRIPLMDDLGISSALVISANPESRRVFVNPAVPVIPLEIKRGKKSRFAKFFSSKEQKQKESLKEHFNDFRDEYSNAPATDRVFSVLTYQKNENEEPAWRYRLILLSDLPMLTKLNDPTIDKQGKDYKNAKKSYDKTIKRIQKVEANSPSFRRHMLNTASLLVTGNYIFPKKN